MIGHDSVPFLPGGDRAIKAPSTGRGSVVFGESDGPAGGDRLIIAQEPHAGSTPLALRRSALALTEPHRSVRIVRFPSRIAPSGKSVKLYPYHPELASFFEISSAQRRLEFFSETRKVYPNYLSVASFCEIC